MSEVDTRFDDEERERLLEEVRGFLPAFLSSASTEQSDPAGDVRMLLGLEELELQRVTAVHLCLSKPIRALFADLRQSMRQPVSQTARPAETKQTVRGAIDWGATVATRARDGGAAPRFVARSAERIFDTPENRALVWLLNQLDIQLRRTPRGREPADDEMDTWSLELGWQRRELRVARKHPWLSAVVAQRPDARTLQRLRAGRSAFYARLIPDAVDALSRYMHEPSAEDVVELLCRRYFRPDKSWKLFELVVALRLAHGFASRSDGTGRLRLLERGNNPRRPFAAYRLDDGDEVRLYYQRWPADTGRSLLAEAEASQNIAVRPKPDIVVQRIGSRPDAIVIELKASRRKRYLGEGLVQLLGYLMDRPDLWRGHPSGWLVAPRSNAFRPVAAPDREIWLVDADDVAAAAVARLAS